MNVVVLRFRRETLGWNVVGSPRESGVLQHFKFIGTLRHVGICWAKTPGGVTTMVHVAQ